MHMTYVVINVHAGQSANDMRFLMAAAVIITIISIIPLFLEVVQFCQLMLAYFFDFTTWVEVSLLVCAIVFAASVFDKECLCPNKWQWQFGIAAVFLVWANLILYLHRIRVLGKTHIIFCQIFPSKVTLTDTNIYVLMFESIFIRFLNFVILTVLLLLMCGLTFHTTFKQFHPFSICQSFSLNMEDCSYACVLVN